MAGSCVLRPLGDVALVLEWEGLNMYVFDLGKGIGSGRRRSPFFAVTKIESRKRRKRERRRKKESFMILS